MQEKSFESLKNVKSIQNIHGMVVRETNQSRFENQSKILISQNGKARQGLDTSVGEVDIPNQITQRNFINICNGGERSPFISSRIGSGSPFHASRVDSTRQSIE